MSKFEKKFKFYWLLCQSTGKVINVGLGIALAAYGISIAAGKGCDYYRNKMREEKFNNNKTNKR